MIDWDRISELRQEVGEEDFEDVVEIFLSEVETEMTELLQDLDAKTVESRLHFLKGSALNLGFGAFADLCQSGEKAANLGQMDGVDIPAIQACYEASKTQFTGMLSRMVVA